MRHYYLYYDGMQHLTREHIFAIYQLGPEAVADLIEELVATCSVEIAQLKERVQALEDQRAQDSHNSHQPPSSDGPKPLARTKSLRKSTGKKAGGQVGHQGTTLKPVDQPDRLVVHRVERCQHCDHSLKKAPLLAYDQRQVFDIPSQLIEVTAHQAEIKACPRCHQQSSAAFPQEVTHRAQYGPRFKAIAIYLLDQQLLPYERTAELFADIFSQPVSVGTLVNFNHECSEALTSYDQTVKEKLLASEVVHFDETGVKITGHLHWLHSASTSEVTFYACHRKRGQAAMNDIGILPYFGGTALHDFWKAYRQYDCQHAFCNAHHLRELTFLHEQHQQQWAQQMIELLREAKAKVDQNQVRLNQDTLKHIEQRYQAILQKGFCANPPPAEEALSKKRGRKKKTRSRNLLERFRAFQKEILAFAYNFKIPFDNNQAERDLRMMKVQQKISGTFRSTKGADAFCRIRGYISTCRKQGYNVLAAIQNAFAHQVVLSWA